MSGMFLRHGVQTDGTKLTLTNTGIYNLFIK